MGRTRQLKYDFFLDEDLSQLPHNTRLCFLGLTTIADREGRLEDRPLRIKAQLFPYENADVGKMLQELAKPREHSDGPFIMRYETKEGRKYIQICNFGKHQNPHPNERKSTIPPPSEDVIKRNYISLNPSECNAGSSGSSGSGYSGPSGSSAPIEACPQTPLRAPTAPVYWEPKPTWRKGHPSLKVALLHVNPEHLSVLQKDFRRVEGGGGGGVKAEISKLKRHALENPSWARKIRDWTKTLTNWLKRADERFDDARFHSARSRDGPKPPRPKGFATLEKFAATKGELDGDG